MQKSIKLSIAHIYKRMEALLEGVPDGLDMDEDSEASERLRDVLALEEEWFVDPMQREYLSLIQWHDK